MVYGVTFSIKRGKCWEKMDICFSEEPELKEVKKEHFTACFLYSWDKNIELHYFFPDGNPLKPFYYFFR